MIVSELFWFLKVVLLVISIRGSMVCGCKVVKGSKDHIELGACVCKFKNILQAFKCLMMAY